MGTGQRVLNVVLAAGAAGLVTMGVLSVGNPAPAKLVVRTGTVQRGDVQATVTATANVSAPTTLNVNFTTGGKVTEIDVAAGDKVTAGQVLAKVDDTSAKASLATAQAGLA